MKSSKTSPPRATIACGRCGRYFLLQAQLALIQLGDKVVPVHPYKRCWSEWEDTFVRQGQISKDGQRIVDVCAED